MRVAVRFFGFFFNSLFCRPPSEGAPRSKNKRERLITGIRVLFEDNKINSKLIPKAKQRREENNNRESDVHVQYYICFQVAGSLCCLFKSLNHSD